VFFGGTLGVVVSYGLWLGLRLPHVL